MSRSREVALKGTAVTGVDPSPRGDTTAQLKADIDSGRTGDKVAFPDPALSPLGTDDEAGGSSAPPEAIAQARLQEEAIGTLARSGNPKAERAWFIPGLLGLLILIVVVVAVWGLSR